MGPAYQVFPQCKRDLDRPVTDFLRFSAFGREIIRPRSDRFLYSITKQFLLPCLISKGSAGSAEKCYCPAHALNYVLNVIYGFSTHLAAIFVEGLVPFNGSEMSRVKRYKEETTGIT